MPTALSTSTATDKGTGKEQHITITSSTNMSKEDIDKAVKDAEKFAEQDKKAKEAVETKNRAESLINRAKTLNDLGDKLTEDDKSAVKTAIEKLRTTVNGGDTDAIKADTEALEKEFYKLSEGLPAVRTAGDARTTPAAAMRAAQTARRHLLCQLRGQQQRERQLRDAEQRAIPGGGTGNAAGQVSGSSEIRDQQLPDGG